MNNSIWDSSSISDLKAAIDQGATTGDHFGPSGFLEMRGQPVKVKSNTRSRDMKSAKKLWNLSEELTGVQY